MSIFAPEELVSSYKTSVTALFALANPVFQGFQAVIELNLQAVKAALAEGEDNLGDAFSGKNPAELIARQFNVTQQFAGKTASYSRHLFEIVSGTQAELGKIAQTQYEEHGSKVQTLADHLAKSGPVGSEAAIAVMKSVFSTASTAAETVRAAARQAIEAAQGNFAATTAPASKAGEQVAAQGSRAAKQ
jgi:phasin family protein